MEENDASKNVVTDFFESACSSPLVSAPSSPDGGGGGGGGFFYSAPASPIHFLLSSSSSSSNHVERNGGGFEFEFTVKEEAAIGAVPADELFLNGQIRPMKLSSHLQLPQILDADEADDDCRVRDIDFRSRSKSLRRRRARSMSPTPSSRSAPFQWLEDFQSKTNLEQQEEDDEEEEEDKVKTKDTEDEKETETTPSGASSRSSSVGRTSKRWVQLKDFLYRSKSEGTNTGNYKFWTSLSKKSSTDPTAQPVAAPEIGTTNKKKKEKTTTTTTNVRKAVNGVGKRMGRSPHELHYTTNRAQAEELRRKTYLPYKQGLLGCLGFSSKSYGAMNGFARALNPVSSR